MSDAEKNILFMYNKLPPAQQMWFLATLSSLIKMPQSGAESAANGAQSPVLH